MFQNYFHKTYLFFSLLLLASSSFGDAYKWVDAEGETHYSQQNPIIIPSEMIKAPPPPAIDPVLAQKEINILMEKQDGTYEEKEKERQRIASEAAEIEKKDEYCQINRSNLQVYQNNPHGRVMDSDGNVSRPTDEQSQLKIAEFQKNIAEHCQ